MSPNFVFKILKMETLTNIAIPVITTILGWFLRPYYEKYMHKPILKCTLFSGTPSYLNQVILKNVKFEISNRSEFVAYSILIEEQPSKRHSIFNLAQKDNVPLLGVPIPSLKPNETVTFNVENIIAKSSIKPYRTWREAMDFVLKSSENNSSLIISFENAKGKRFFSSYSYNNGDLNYFRKKTISFALFQASSNRN